MHFSFNPSKEFRIRVSKRRYAIVAGAVGPVAPSTGIFEETQNKIDNSGANLTGSNVCIGTTNRVGVASNVFAFLEN